MDWATGLQLAGIGIADFSAIQSSKMGASAYKISAEQNRVQADEARRLSRYRVRLIHEAGAEHLSAIEAETGKGGLAMTGTPLLSLVTDAREIELTAALEDRAGRITEQNYRLAARMDEKSAKAAAKAGKSKMSGLIGGAAGFALGGPWGAVIGYAGGSIAGGL